MACLLLAANPLIEEFWSKIEVSNTRFFNDTPCWEWQAGRLKRGYGYLVQKGQPVLTHRFAYEQLTGQPLGKLYGCHHCDNPPCCNPAHIYPGTQIDNIRDMFRKGRARRLRGEKSPNAKILDEEISEIFELRQHGLRQGEISVLYGVSTAQISNILSQKQRAITTRPPPGCAQRQPATIDVADGGRR